MERQPDDSTGVVAPAWADWQSSGLLSAIPGAVVGTDLDGRILYWNAAAEQLYGFTSEQMLGVTVLDVFVEAHDQHDAASVMAGVLGGRSWTGEFAVKTGYGSTVTVRLTDSPLWRDGQVCGVIGVADVVPVFDAAATATRLAEARVTRLARVTAELASADDTDAVTAIVIAHAADAVGASVASLSLLTDDDTLTLVGLRGGSPNPEEWSTYPLSADLPTSEAVRTGQVVVVAGHEQIAARYPALANRVATDRSMVCLPVTVGDRRLGAISLGFAELRMPDEQEMELLLLFANTCAQAIERLQALAQAKSAAAKLSFLAEVSVELAASLDLPITLAKVAALAVPTLADWCAVEILEDGQLRTLAVEHTDPAKVALAQEFQRRYPPDRDAPTGSANVVRTGRSELYAEITDDMLVAGARDEDHLRLIRELGLVSALFVPLATRGRVLGTLTLVSAESGRRYDAGDLAFAEHLARRAAMAIDNAQLFTQTQEVAVRLQRAVLPSRLPMLPGWEVACHYTPAGRTDVGGDFYDLIGLPDQRLVAVVGDVMGRGVPAAAAMAQMRAAIRAYVATDPDPVVVLRKLDNMFELFELTRLVTLVYLLVDPRDDTVTVVSAGHLPPLLIDRDGRAAPIWAPISPPLGVGGQRAAHATTLLPGDTILAYTDGLVERRDDDIDRGISRLADAAAVLREGDIAQGLHDVVVSQAQTSDDDITALAFRRVR